MEDRNEDFTNSPLSADELDLVAGGLGEKIMGAVVAAVIRTMRDGGGLRDDTW